MISERTSRRCCPLSVPVPRAVTRGTPLGVVLSGANRHDSMMLEAALGVIPGVRSGRRGRPRHQPKKLHADKGYDYRRCREECRKRGILPRIAHRGADSSSSRCPTSADAAIPLGRSRAAIP